MKKFAALLCLLCAVTLFTGCATTTPQFSKNNDLAQIMIITEAYFNAYQKGDKTALLSLMTPEFKEEAEAEYAESPHLFRLKSLILQKTQYEIVDYSKDTYEDEIYEAEADIRVLLIMPDIYEIFESMPEIEDEDEMTEEQYIAAACDALEAYFAQNQVIVTEEEHFDLTLVKQNGAWKVDSEY